MDNTHDETIEKALFSILDRIDAIEQKQAEHEMLLAEHHDLLERMINTESQVAVAIELLASRHISLSSEVSKMFSGMLEGVTHLSEVVGKVVDKLASDNS